MASLDYETEKTAFREFYDGSRALMEAASSTYVTLIRSLLATEDVIASAKVEGRIKDREECLGKFRRKYQPCWKVRSENTRSATTSPI